VSAADRDYFLVHKERTDAGLFIGIPIRGRLTGTMSVSVSRRLTYPDGSFAGVVAASLDLNYFKALFGRVVLGEGGNVTLSNLDGVVLMRWPYDPKFIGMNLRNAKLYAELAQARTGQFETVAATDGVARMIAYSQVGDLPLVVGVGQATAAIYAQWYQSAAILLLLDAAFLLTFAILLRYLVREFKRRAHSETNLATTLRNMSQGVCMFDRSQRLLVCNDRYTEMYGLAAEQTKPGVTLHTILQARVAAGQSPEDANSYIQRRLEEVTAPESHYVENELRDGRWVSVTHQPLQGGGWVAIHQDITERRRAEKEIAYLATHDVLTGLANRAYFMERVAEASAHWRRNAELFTVLMFDLDRFKAVNDSLGHAAGDVLLKELGQRLKSSLRETDVLARLGGGEFVILQRPEKVQHSEAIALATRIVDIVARPFNLGGQEVVIGASIGIALAPQDGAEPDELLKKADLALYRAKANAGNGFNFFETAMTAKVDRSDVSAEGVRSFPQGECPLASHAA
jgi:diguanylate cyclase (GGDEF)-like protein/PAS domain S-box-containing protein